MILSVGATPVKVRLLPRAYDLDLDAIATAITPRTRDPRSLLAHTYSKSALAPGQRLGFLALAPDMPAKPELRRAVMAAGLGSGNGLPDAIMQYALPDIDRMPIDLARLQSKRDRLAAALREYGYELRIPETTFYLLVKAPITDDVEFARRLRKDGVLVLAGRTVDMPGDFRISLTATDDTTDRALPVFAAASRTRSSD
jgi:aspartate aminotransferase